MSTTDEVVPLRGDSRVHIHFRTSYYTRWGQSLVLVGASALMGNWDPARGHEMRCHHESKDTLVWEVLISVPWQAKYKYKYAIVRHVDGEVKVNKWDVKERELVLPGGLTSGDVVEVIDCWADPGHPGSIMSSHAFTEIVKCTPPAAPPRTPVRFEPVLGEAIVRFVVSDVTMSKGDVLCVSGAAPALGHWQQAEVLELAPCNGHVWSVEVRLPYTHFPFHYKYCVRSADGSIELEVGEQRVMKLPLAGSAQMGAPALIVCDDGFFRRDRMWRGAGVALPLFSLRTNDSVGVGEFLDLIKIIDLAAECGLRLIQLLPVNDTGVYDMWWDSYPYSTLSVHALHPQYLAVRALRKDLGKDVAEELLSAREALDLKDADYEATVSTKLRLARIVFDRHGDETLTAPDFKAWLEQNADWLKPYALFCHLKQLFGTAEHWQWGLLANPTEETLARLTGDGAPHHRQLLFTYWLQYHLHCQLTAAAKHATAKKVVLKGDIPIGVDKRSVDTWMEPHLFRMDKSTGAPPDYFDPNGQNWGFPTYDWDAMAKDDYGWWRRRLSHMAQYFSAYRIDHVLGFFRIWEIPGDCTTGRLGYFRPSVPLSKAELESRGLWDIQRLTEPYVRWHLLNELFGKQAPEVAARFFEEPTPGCFRFRAQYASEAQISKITVRPDSPRWLLDETERVRTGLMRLRQNVVLVPDPESPGAYHPRFALMSTSSFKELPPQWRDALAWLHDDYLFQRQDELWRESALRKLPALMGATRMLVCGEDLGFVPECVEPVMQELGLIGLRIQRMSTEKGAEFNNPANYPFLTVASPSCHDVSPMRLWYEEDPQRRDRFFYGMLQADGTPPEKCTPDIMRIVVQQHLSCPSVWAIFPIQDLMALSAQHSQRPPAEELINDPTTTKHYWRYRMHKTVEELAGDVEWVALIKGMLADSGRA